MNANHKGKINILFVVENSPGILDCRVWPEAKSLIASGFDVSILSPQNIKTSTPKIKDGIKLYEYPHLIEMNNALGILLEYLFSAYFILMYALKIYLKRPFNIVHLANPPDFLCILFLPFKILGVKIIFDHHDLSPELFLEKFFKKNFLFYILKILEKFSYKLSDIIIAPNNSYKALGAKRNKVSLNKIFVVRNGPDLNIVKPYPPIDKIKKYLIVFIGKMEEQDGVVKLVYSIDHIVNTRNFKDFKVLVIGDGNDKKRIERIIANKNLKEFFILHGAEYNKKKLFSFISTADICVDPERESELSTKSTHLKTLEYMALGKSIIQYNRKEGRFSAGKSSVYIQNNDEKAFGDAIISLLQDEKKRKEMGKYGKERVQKYLQWDTQKKELLRAYKEITF